MSLFRLKEKLLMAREEAQICFENGSPGNISRGEGMMEVIRDVCAVFHMDLDDKTFRIPCFWEMQGFVEVSAKTLEEAKEKAKDAPLTQGDYVPDSFEIDEQMLEHMLDIENMTDEEKADAGIIICDKED